MICVCMPATRLFLQKCWPSRFGSSKDPRSGYARHPDHSDIDRPGAPTLPQLQQQHRIELQQRQAVAPWTEAADADLVKSFDVGVSQPHSHSHSHQRAAESDELKLIDQPGSGATRGRGWSDASVGLAR